MIGLSVILDGDGCWPDLAENPPTEAVFAAVAALPAGMASGRPSIALRVDLPDGSVVVAQTSYRLFQAAARALAARYGDPG